MNEKETKRKNVFTEQDKRTLEELSKRMEKTEDIEELQELFSNTKTICFYKKLEQIEENQATMIQLLCDLLNKTE